MAGAVVEDKSFHWKKISAKNQNSEEPNYNYNMSFPGGTVVKNPPANTGDGRDTDSITGLGRSPVGGYGIHSSILAWRIPWTEEPGGLLLVWSQSWTQRSTRTHVPQIRGTEEYWTDPGNSSPLRLDTVATVGGIKSR